VQKRGLQIPLDQNKKEGRMNGPLHY
jgi:hypothetical protein